jgi:hypothetical protein
VAGGCDIRGLPQLALFFGVLGQALGVCHRHLLLGLWLGLGLGLLCCAVGEDLPVIVVPCVGGLGAFAHCGFGV